MRSVAGAILSNRIQEWGIYDASSVDTARSDYPTTNAPAVDRFRTDTLPAFPTLILVIVDHRDEI